MKDLNKVFAKNVFRVCEEKGIKITPFSKKNHLDRSRVYKAYYGDSGASLNMVQKWADALGVSAIELLKE